MTVLLWALGGYLAGSFPSAWVVATLAARRDALDAADRSSSAGDAHHLLRGAVGGRAAAAAAATDIVKAFVPTLIASLVVGPHEAAACGIAAVAGHCWPPVLRRTAGRGLAAGAGAYLAVVPVEMVAGGLVTLIGTIARIGGPASTVGFLAIPILAHLRRQPDPQLVAAWVVFLLIVVRRLEGIAADVQHGASPSRAAVRRVVLDVSGSPPSEEDGDR